jgi:hypothetical protein
MARFLTLAAIAVILMGLRTAQAQVFTANLDGPSEADPNASPGTGFGRLSIDPVAHTFRIEADFTGLVGTVTAAHIHGPTAVPLTGAAGVMTQTPTFLGFPSGVTSGVYDNTYDMTLTSTWNAAFVTANGGTPAGAEAAFIAAVTGGRTYLNIHSTSFPGGEIRGFLVPEPATLLLLPMAGMLLLRRRISA